ncbi:transferrin-binding protein-like solute binding protein [Qipengyuania aquimaris]|uniref:transferrin-binding protein-like solute binding protein n=1 Tax=Qipengyuania aquimaris TaxID=255984 RepID=UPI001FD44674|nr:transferrin-binding protein-like solute binding protein [Qipengyuania aquimaris]UOR16486.1 transferrin-binding protein-like solute binding protein [Qipengyuania aquimaris]
MDSMPELSGPQGFGAGGALAYDGTALTVGISTQNNLSQSWTSDQRANRTTGWGPDEDQYSWLKTRPSGGNLESLKMFVPAYGAGGPSNLNDYSRMIVADIVGVGTIPSLTYCVAGDPTVVSDLPAGQKTYPEVDVRWGQPWEFDGSKGVRGSFTNLDSVFEMDADFAAKTVSFNITLNSNAFALDKIYGPYTGTGTIGDDGEISADIATADGLLQLRGSFFGPEAGEFALVYGLAEDINNDGTNDLVFLGAVGGRD